MCPMLLPCKREKMDFVEAFSTDIVALKRRRQVRFSHNFLLFVFIDIKCQSMKCAHPSVH